MALAVAPWTLQGGMDGLQGEPPMGLMLRSLGPLLAVAAVILLASVVALVASFVVHGHPQAGGKLLLVCGVVLAVSAAAQALTLLSLGERVREGIEQFAADQGDEQAREQLRQFSGSDVLTADIWGLLVSPPLLCLAAGVLSLRANAPGTTKTEPSRQPVRAARVPKEALRAAIRAQAAQDGWRLDRTEGDKDRFWRGDIRPPELTISLEEVAGATLVRVEGNKYARRSMQEFVAVLERERVSEDTACRGAYPGSSRVEARDECTPRGDDWHF
jgi:hypothetical protein